MAIFAQPGFDELLRAMNVGILVVGAGGDIMQANDVAARLLGVPAGDLCRRSIFDDLWSVYAEDGRRLEEDERPRGHVLMADEPIRDVIGGVGSADGGITWLQISAEPVRGADGSLDCMIFSMLDVTERLKQKLALETRERQQEAAADLGQMALRGASIGAVLGEIVRCLSSVLDVPLVAVLEFDGESGDLRIAAIEGWDSRVLTGEITVRPDSQAAYTLRTEESVVVYDARAETRFTVQEPEGVSIASGMSAVIPGEERPAGVITLHTTERRIFTQDDVHFLQSVANVLGAVIARDAERAATEAQRVRLHEIFMRTPASIAVVRGPDYRFELANPGFVSVMGDREYIGRPAREVLHEDDYDPFFEILDGVFQTGRPYEGREFRVQVAARIEPRQRYLNFVVMPTRDSSGEVDGAIVHGVDVTDLVLARRRVERMAVQRDVILRQTVESVVIADSGGEIVFANDAARRMLGIDPTGARLERWGEVFNSHDAGGNLVRPEDTTLGRALLLGETVVNAERHIARPDGTEMIGVGNAVPLYGEDGTLLGAVAIFRDVTSEHQAARQKSDFLSAAAHDLKGPLTTVKGHAQLLLRRARRSEFVESERVISDAERIEATATRMANLITELLDVTRIEMGASLDLVRRPVNLVPLTEEVVIDHARSEAEGRIVFSSAEASLIGMWDELRLARVVGNLISNALKYSADDTTVWVSLEADSSDGRHGAALRVRDEGLGIPASDLPRIFERFFRAGNVPGGIEGTGIGLAGVRQVVEQLGGTVSVESTENVGTTVTVWLPLGEDVPSGNSWA